MGEKIKTLSKGKLLNADFEIELNHPPSSGQDQQIHIQSDKFRFEINNQMINILVNLLKTIQIS